MATDNVLKIKANSQNSLVGFMRKVIEYHTANHNEMVNKMDIIDAAYARYKASQQVNSDGGVDVRAGDTSCDVFATNDKVTPPIVVSQVDAYIAYLSDVFLSGTPLFPVVSTPATRKIAEQLETLIDDHSVLGEYPRQLLMFLRDGVKYNYSGIEVEWDAVDQFSSLSDYLPGAANTGTGANRRLRKDDKFFNKLKRIDPRNLIRDYSVLPGSVSREGDYVGYVERLSATALKRKLIKWAKQDKAFNIDKAMACGHMAGVGTEGTHAYRIQPQISDYVNTSRTNPGGVDWDAYANGSDFKGQRKQHSYGQKYELITLYARIQPSDHGIVAPQPNTPQIWKLVLVNNLVLVSAHRIVSAYDYLPILIGQPLEDGFAEQTQSIAESEIPFQEAAETLFNIRFAAARRAVSDRALYNSNYLKSKDINSKAAAPKIPVNISPLSPISLQNLYHQIPFDMRGTETTIQDAQTIVAFSKELHGLNNPRMGMFQKGNKSVKEWDDTMAGSDGRLRLPALTLEYQIFMPLKSMMKLNIFQYGDNAELVSQKTGDLVKINIDQLRNTTLSFRVGDGYNPKAKLASTEMIGQGLQLIQASPILQQAYGTSLPAMFEHMMSLAGVKGLEEYNPQWQPPANGTGTGVPNENLVNNMLQAPGTPVGASLTPPVAPISSEIQP